MLRSIGPSFLRPSDSSPIVKHNNSVGIYGNVFGLDVNTIFIILLNDRNSVFLVCINVLKKTLS